MLGMIICAIISIIFQIALFKFVYKLCKFQFQISEFNLETQVLFRIQKKKINMQLKLVCLFAAVTLFCVGDAKGNLLWNLFQTWKLDRTVPQYVSPGFYVSHIDRTAFNVSELVWLKEFDLPRVYAYDPVNDVPIDDVKVNVKIVEISTVESKQKTVFSTETIVNSTEEATVYVEELGLKPGHVYEIHVEIPQETHLLYSEFLEIKEYSLRRFLKNPIHVQFFQHNESSKPPTDEKTARQPSYGMVKRVYLKYKRF